MVIEQNIKIEKYFDANWYVNSYPDVAAAGVEPLKHYINYGRLEGRLPCKIEALELERELWAANNTGETEKKLLKLFNNASNVNCSLAGWVLSRWYGSYGKWGLVEQYLPKTLQHPLAMYLIAHQGPYLLLFDAYYWQGKLDSAQTLVDDNAWLTSNNKLLAKNMLLEEQGRSTDLSLFFAKNNLLKLDTKQPNKPLGLDNLVGIVEQKSKTLKDLIQPLVSIIIPCFNAQSTIETAISSLLLQTWRNLEIIVVDDASTDNSWKVLTQLAESDSRIKIFCHEANLGAYRARNYGLSLARGKYITVHDIDDWSHPQKIEKQVQVMRKNRRAVASVSHWVRADEKLQFQRWRMEDGWIYRNVSSLMIKQKVFRRLGYWDNVSVNADTEFYHRILAEYGTGAIVEVLPGIPLSFGRATNESLSQTKASHLRTQFKGLRKDYHDAAAQWHASGNKLYLARLPDKRPFTVPPQMLRGSAEQRKHNIILLLQASEVFDSTWYLNRYPDIAKAGVDPVEHFVKHGINEGRDCNPIVSISGLAYLLSLDNLAVIENLLQSETLPKRVEIEGHLSLKSDKPTILCVAHMVSAHTFGAERSFLDMLSMLCQSDFNIVVVLPNAGNLEYIHKIRTLCSTVIFQPMAWWSLNRNADEKVVKSFNQIIAQHNISVVYVNTLVLLEPLISAKKNDVSTVMHVRELPPHDPHLCDVLGADAEKIRSQCLDHCDYFIANSKVVLNYIDAKERSFLVPNVFDIDASVAKTSEVNAPIRASIFSSNLPKKGINDLLEVADVCLSRNLQIEFHIYGPENEFTENWKKRANLKNVKWQGYCSNTTEALKSTDILLNLSHFQESFGRSVLEGMANGCAVVAYNWGAIPELVDEDCGILVTYKNVDGVVSALEKLLSTPSLLRELGENGRHKVLASYSLMQVKPILINAIKQISS